jgi:DNA-binding transcriptional LysR family regulator
VLESATRILDELARVEEESVESPATVRHHPRRDPVQHRLSLVATASCRVQPQTSSCEYQLRPDNTDRPVQALLEGEIDLAILTDEPSDRRLRCGGYSLTNMIALSTREHRFATRTWISPRELAASTCSCTPARPTVVLF